MDELRLEKLEKAPERRHIDAEELRRFIRWYRMEFEEMFGKYLSVLEAFVSAFEEDTLDRGDLTRAVAKHSAVSERQARTHVSEFRRIVREAVRNGNQPLRHLHELLAERC